jgi:hypothetical protein
VGRKVSRLFGVIGAVPAIGLLALQPAAAAALAAHAPGKTVRADVSYQPGTAPDAHCVARAKSKHTKKVSGVRLTFWTAPGHDATCIGTIKLSGYSGLSSMGEYVSNYYGAYFCSDQAYFHSSKLTFQCRDYFRYRSLGVVADWKVSGKPHHFKLPV